MIVRPNKKIAERLRHTFIWLTVTCVTSLSAALLVMRVEQHHNPGLDELNEILWWWIVTITGLGYGDLYPITPVGRFLTVFIILSGLILLAIVISEVANLLKLTFERKQKGIIHIGYSGHVVLFGYTSLTAGVVKLLRNYFGKSLKIVLISNDTSFNPFPKEVDFIFANPIDRDTFVEANVAGAKASIILANDRFTDPDAYSIVIATGVESFNSHSTTIVEIMDDEYKELYKGSNIEAFIRRKELLGDLLAKEREPKLIRILEKETNLKFDGDAKSSGDLL